MLARLGWPLVALLVATVPQQQQPPFRAGVESVAIYATVFDRSNNIVRHLARNDFTVFDEGHRQNLTVFENTIQPITAILLMDTSASMTLTLDLARQAAEQFVIRLSPGDKVRVGGFSETTTLSEGFTDDRDRLLRFLRDDLRIGNRTRLWDSLDETIGALSDLGGRRVVILITDGEDIYSALPPRDLIERAKIAGVMVYAVQIRSRSRPGMELSITGPGGPGYSSAPRVAVPPTQVLRELAAETGGSHFVLGPRDDVNATFTQVALELHHQYVLGFTPQRLDGKLHELEVRVRDPRWTVRARRFYLASKAAVQ